MLILVIILHAVLVNVDDHCFNNKRSHSKYETISVITNAILFLIPQVMAIFFTYSEEMGLAYKIIAGLSMLSIVQSETFHQNLELKERLVHACLYILHPIVLFTFFESWQNNYFEVHPNFWMIQLMYVGVGFKTISYQIIYWNYIHDK